MIPTIFSKLQGGRKILNLIFSLNHDDNMPLSLKCIAVHLSVQVQDYGLKCDEYCHLQLNIYGLNLLNFPFYSLNLLPSNTKSKNMG